MFVLAIIIVVISGDVHVGYNNSGDVRVGYNNSGDVCVGYYNSGDDRVGFKYFYNIWQDAGGIGTLVATTTTARFATSELHISLESWKLCAN